MIETFRRFNPKGNLRVKYKDDSGSEGIWEANQQELLDRIIAIVEAYQQQGIKLTNRQLYYQLVSDGNMPNSEATYKRICTFLTDARYGGRIDWEAIEDRGRQPHIPLEFASIKERIDLAVRNFRLERWSDQDCYVELYSEKQAMESVLQPVADKFHITFGANKGYSSASTMYDLAQRIKDKINDGKRCIVLYFGDHDPSGLDMVRDIRDRIGEFLTGGDNPIQVDEEIEDFFEVKPLALNMSQIKKYNPPPNPAKITDPRAKWYIQKYGEKSWELDALKPNVLIKLAEDGVLEVLDVGKYNAWIKLENKQKKALQEFGNKLEVKK